jgi:pimeloyl-ACP methyl ester carboxylesterase
MNAGLVEQGTRAREIVEAGDVQIEVIAEGRGPLVVLLPSAARDSEDFDIVAEGIAATGFRVLRPQPRGMAGSVGPLQHLTLHDLAADVAAVIAHEGAGPAVIVGHAFGQWIGRMAAVDHPDLVRGVVLAAAAAKQVPQALRDALAKAADATLPKSERLAALSLAFFAPGYDPSSWLTGWHNEAGASQRAASAATRQEEWWSGGKVPLLDLQAACDPWRPRATEASFRREFGADRVTTVVVENASHALLPEQPQAVIAAIVAWLRGL